MFCYMKINQWCGLFDIEYSLDKDVSSELSPSIRGDVDGWFSIHTLTFDSRIKDFFVRSCKDNGLMV